MRQAHEHLQWRQVVHSADNSRTEDGWRQDITTQYPEITSQQFQH